MAGIRAYIYSPPGSSSCPSNLANGCYNTGHIDPDAPAGQACLNPDPQQFENLQAMIAYANSRGEALRQFTSVAEVNAVCGGSPVSAAPAGTSTGAVATCGMGPCGPTEPTVAPSLAAPVATTASGGGSGGFGGGAVVTTAPSGQTTIQAGGRPSNSPTSGSFSGTSTGFGGATSAKGTGASVTTAGTQPVGSASPVAVTGFDILAFIKSPLGILLVVLLLVVLMLTRKGG